MAAAPPEHRVEVEETAPRTFTLKVHFDGHVFDCGNYLTRPAALQAGRLFVERKLAESSSRKKHPGKKR